MYYSLPILRARENEEGATGVTVGSEMDERDLKQAGRTVCASLCIRYLPIFFLVGQSSSAKKFPCGLFLRFLSLKKTVYYHLICSSTRLSSPLPFHVTQSLDLFSFFPTTGVSRSATLHHLSTRGFPPDDDDFSPQVENSSTSIFRNI